jgi:hypothetical protein
MHTEWHNRTARAVLPGPSSVEHAMGTHLIILLHFRLTAYAARSFAHKGTEKCAVKAKHTSSWNTRGPICSRVQPPLALGAVSAKGGVAG